MSSGASANADAARRRLWPPSRALWQRGGRSVSPMRADGTATLESVLEHTAVHVLDRAPCRQPAGEARYGQVGAADNIFIGDNVVAAGATKITGNVPAGRVIMGYPATKMDTQVAMYKALRRLPRLMADLSELQKAVFKPAAKD